MYTQLLSFSESGAMIDANAMYSKIDRQINKLTKLINDLLDTSNLDQGLLAYHFEHFRLDEMLKEIIETVQLTTSHKLTITAIEPTSVYADKLRIEQVVNNLLTNAIKFSPLQQRVEISLFCSHGLAVSKITAFGMGIPEKERDTIFRKYHRIDRKNSNTFPGLGLGLFIVRNIIEKHNGEIWVESEEGKGSSFYFNLPIDK